MKKYTPAITARTTSARTAISLNEIFRGGNGGSDPGTGGRPEQPTVLLTLISSGLRQDRPLHFSRLLLLYPGSRHSLPGGFGRQVQPCQRTVRNGPVLPGRAGPEQSAGQNLRSGVRSSGLPLQSGDLFCPFARFGEGVISTCWSRLLRRPSSGGRFTESVSFTTGVPHRLQNADSGGTRLPHRLQKEPVGREVVSMGTGIAGAASTIFFMGRAISIRFFGGGVLVISIQWGADAAGCAAVRVPAPWEPVPGLPGGRRSK